MSKKSIFVVFEKKSFDNNRVLNSKFVVVLRTLFFASRRDRFEIFDVSRDLWLRVFVQRAKRQKLDDELHMMRNVYLNSIFFFLIMIRFFSFNVRK
jgi:hypothetical protein